MNGYEVAMYNLTMGVQCIPLNEFKTPKISFKDIPIDETFIQGNQWLYEQANCLGILTRGLWCIDIDNHDDSKNGFASLESVPYFQELDANARQTMIQSTPSGGMHIIFKKHPGIEYSQKIAYLDGVDIKANDNNYFVMAGSVTAKGIYRRNDLPPKEYDGDFEKRIFGNQGNFVQQIMDRYSAKNVMSNHDFSHLPPKKGKGGLGKKAYQRILEGASLDRNNDLYLAANYANACGVSIEPLKTIIGTVKGKDRFSENEFWKTVNSAVKR